MIPAGVSRLLVAGWAREAYSLTRFAMYKKLGEIGDSLELRGRVLSISHSEGLCDVLRIREPQIVPANYPDHNMLSLGFPDGSFDVVVSDQVLEHVEENPQSAINEAYRVLRKGGVAVHTTCFINPVHAMPGDFWRFTAEGLSVLCREQGEVIEIGQWGNRRAWVFISLGLRGERVPKWAHHPLKRAATVNNPSWPIVTWIVARKR